jgi:predicted Kef-type K+ transport protein
MNSIILYNIHNLNYIIKNLCIRLHLINNQNTEQNFMLTIELSYLMIAFILNA